MISLWKARRARKAAVAAIEPFFALGRLRREEIADAAWLDPYVLGFLSMLATLVATRTAGRLKSQVLALVQAEAVGELTGLDPVYVGEQIVLLSTGDDPAFVGGCRAAVQFLEQLEGHAAPLEVAGDQVVVDRPWPADEAEPDTFPAGADARALWQSLFEERLETLSTPALL